MRQAPHSLEELLAPTVFARQPAWTWKAKRKIPAPAGSRTPIVQLAISMLIKILQLKVYE
jgi:hypothetical protein